MVGVDDSAELADCATRPADRRLRRIRDHAVGKTAGCQLDPNNTLPLLGMQKSKVVFRSDEVAYRENQKETLEALPAIPGTPRRSAACHPHPSFRSSDLIPKAEIDETAKLSCH